MSIAAHYSSSIILNRWLGAWIDIAILMGFLLLPDYVLGNALYRQTLFIWLGLFVLYFPVTETLWGKSPGKFISRIRVVNARGDNPSWGQSIVRTLFRLLEVNPFLAGGLVAGIAVLVSTNKQRLGDMAAGTYVLREQDARDLIAKGAIYDNHTYTGV